MALKKKGARPCVYQWLIWKYSCTSHVLWLSFPKYPKQIFETQQQKRKPVGTLSDGDSERPLPITFLSRGTYFRSFEFHVCNSKNYSFRGRAFSVHCFFNTWFFHWRWTCRDFVTGSSYTISHCFLLHKPYSHRSLLVWLWFLSKWFCLGLTKCFFFFHFVLTSFVFFGCLTPFQ